MPSPSLSALLLTLLLAGVLPFPAYSGSFIVDNTAPGASDSGTGSAESPWLTIQHGIDHAMPGDTVLVRAGSYGTPLQWVRSGSSSAPIVLQAWPGEEVILDGSGSLQTKFIDWKGSASNGTDKHYLIIDGFIIRNVLRWAIWIEGDHNIIRNCTIHDCGLSNLGVGILIRRGNYNIIRNNEVYRCGWNGINAEDSEYTLIENNRSHDNPLHFGINIFPNTTGPQTLQNGNRIRNNTLYNNLGGIYTRYQADGEISGNLIYNNTGNGIFLHRHHNGPESYVSNTLIANNTIVNNGFSGIRNNSAGCLRILNNIFQGHSEANRHYEIYMHSTVTDGHELNHNLYFADFAEIVYWGGDKYQLSDLRTILQRESNGKFAEPLFAGLPAADFRLSSASPAIDMGSAGSGDLPAKDLLGTSRPSGAAIDAGALEFPSEDPTAPSLPGNLQIRTN